MDFFTTIVTIASGLGFFLLVMVMILATIVAVTYVVFGVAWIVNTVRKLARR